MRTLITTTAIAAVLTATAAVAPASAADDDMFDLLDAPSSTQVGGIRAADPFGAPAEGSGGTLKGKITLKGSFDEAFAVIFTHERPSKDSPKLWLALGPIEIGKKGNWSVDGAPNGEYAVQYLAFKYSDEGDVDPKVWGFEFAGDAAAPWQGRHRSITKNDKVGDFGTEKLAVASNKPVWSGEPADISGKVEIGKTVTVKINGLMKNSANRIVWASSESERASNGAKYTVRKSDGTNMIVPLISPWKKGHPSPALTSGVGFVQVTEPLYVEGLPLDWTKPEIMGDPSVGTELRVRTGTWTTGTEFSYQWYADGVPIAGATAREFVPDASYENVELTVEVTGTKKHYEPKTRVSLPVVVEYLPA